MLFDIGIGSEVLECSLPVRSFKTGYADDFQDGVVESLNFAFTLGLLGYAFSMFKEADGMDWLTIVHA